MSGISKMKERVSVYGKTADERLADAKLRSMNSASMLSYQAEDITFKGQKYRCLINPSKLVEDYDQKIISIDFKVNMKPGEVFYWNRTDTHWIGLYRQWTEEAYLRMEIRRCNYEITINDTSNYWVYVKGPTQTGLDWNEEHDINWNDLNYHLMMYITSNEETRDYFDRFNQIKLNGDNYKVVATDKITSSDYIQVYLQEDFNKNIIDKAKEEENNKASQVKIEKENKANTEEKEAAKKEIDIILKPKISISGPEMVYCYDTDLRYNVNREELFNDNFTYSWKVDTNKVDIIKQEKSYCILNINYKKPNTFKLSLLENDIEIAAKEIIVQSI